MTIQRAAAPKPEPALPDVGWTDFNGNLYAQRYSPLDQINATNVAQLQVAWRWPAGMFGPSPEIKNVSSPLVADGTMYATVGVTRNVVAIDPGTGEVLWLWRADEGKRFDNAARKGSGRGVAYWKDGSFKRVSTSRRATPSSRSMRIRDFRIRRSATTASSTLPRACAVAKDRKDLDIGLSFPPTVLDGVIVVGAAMRVAFRPPSKANVKGDVRGFDARTGKLLWTFHTIPLPGEKGVETWLKGAAEYTGNAGVWASMSGDPALGLVYLPVESATGDRYGGDRPGANLYANSLVALEVKTGKMRWQYQIIHHDIWDWDNPSAPILADLPNGKKIVMQLTKQAFAYTFDRATGEPIWPIKGTQRAAVGRARVNGLRRRNRSRRSPHRSIVQGFSEKDLIDFTPEVLAAAKDAIKPYRLEPALCARVARESEGRHEGHRSRCPSSTGGANWESGAIDPETGILYVPSRTAVDVLALVNDPKASTVPYIQGWAAHRA